jgi:hypothetical protein
MGSEAASKISFTQALDPCGSLPPGLLLAVTNASFRVRDVMWVELAADEGLRRARTQPVVPEPRKGSSIVPPGGETRRISLLSR